LRDEWLSSSEIKWSYIDLEKVQAPNADSLKNIAYALRNQFEDLLLVLAADVDSKPQVTVMIGEKLALTNKFSCRQHGERTRQRN